MHNTGKCSLSGRNRNLAANWNDARERKRCESNPTINQNDLNQKSDGNPESRNKSGAGKSDKMEKLESVLVKRCEGRFLKSGLVFITKSHEKARSQTPSKSEQKEAPRFPTGQSIVMGGGTVCVSS